LQPKFGIIIWFEACLESHQKIFYKICHQPTSDCPTGYQKEELKMKRINKFLALSLSAMMLGALITSCALPSLKVGSNGTTWGTGAFGSNGERIYFTSTSERGSKITYDDGPDSNGWMMMGNGQLACASCHGPDGSGGEHGMGQMQVMSAPDIRWSAIGEEFDAELFGLAVTKGEDPDGSQLSTDMPRWQMGDDDLADLLDYIKKLP
jgi:hypothetical protein